MFDVIHDMFLASISKNQPENKPIDFFDVENP